MAAIARARERDTANGGTKRDIYNAQRARWPLARLFVVVCRAQCVRALIRRIRVVDIHTAGLGENGTRRSGNERAAFGEQLAPLEGGSATLLQQ